MGGSSGRGCSAVVEGRGADAAGASTVLVVVDPADVDLASIAAVGLEACWGGVLGLAGFATSGACCAGGDAEIDTSVIGASSEPQTTGSMRDQVGTRHHMRKNADGTSCGWDNIAPVEPAGGKG